MQQVTHFEESFSPVAMIDNIHTLFSLGAAQGKSVFIIDVNNAFQNTFQCDVTKRTYNIIPPLFSEYLLLHWPDHPDIATISAYPQLYALQNYVPRKLQKMRVAADIKSFAAPSKLLAFIAVYLIMKSSFRKTLPLMCSSTLPRMIVFVVMYPFHASPRSTSVFRTRAVPSL
jgi:hypothetical protein